MLKPLDLINGEKITTKKMTNYKELVKQRTSISGNVEEVERFSTWWSNNNAATAVVYNNGYYRVFLLVYDPVYSSYKPAVFPESYDCSYWGDNSRGRKAHNYLSDAKSEANWLRSELSGSYGKYVDNPILLINPYCDCSRSFDNIVNSPYVTSTSDFKPFDIVQTHTTRLTFDFYHVGVYLGNGQVCHFTRDKNDTTIDSLSYFKEGEVIGYHPVIPFKNYKDIAKQVVWAKDNHFRKGNYSLPKRNCEHLANMCVYGINFSDQIDKNKEKIIALGSSATAYATYSGTFIAASSVLTAPVTFGLSLIPGAIGVTASVAGVVDTYENYGDINSSKRDINLRDEINESNSLLGKKSDSETDQYERQYLQEIPPKQDCVVM